MSTELRSAGNLASAIRMACRPQSDCTMSRIVATDVRDHQCDELGRSWDVRRCQGAACASCCPADAAIEALRIRYRLAADYG